MWWSRCPRWPATVDAAVDHLLCEMSDEEKRRVRGMSERDFFQSQNGRASSIRTLFGLLQGNKALLKSCGSGDMHPDTAAHILLQALWKRLQSPPARESPEPASPVSTGAYRS